MKNYQQIAKQSRIKVLELIHDAGTSHFGSNLGCTEICLALFDEIDFEQDRFVAGKSWAAATIYYNLWRKGRISEEELNSFCKPGSPYIGLVEPHRDVPFGIGSMGFAVSAGCGFAWSKKQLNQAGRVLILESDGGFHEGSTWEGLMFASEHKLNNLKCILDSNKFCAMGPTKDILNQEYLCDVLKKMGWEVSEVDGHDVEAIRAELSRETSKPHFIIARTLKGKGVSFCEGNNLWHYAQVKDDDYEKAKAELNG